MGGAGKTAIVVSGVFGEGGKRGMGGFQWFVQRLCLMTCVELRDRGFPSSSVGKES